MSSFTLEHLERICLSAKLTEEDCDQVIDTFIVGEGFISTSNDMAERVIWD